MELGSCIKPITAMAVMQLVDRGLIKLDDPINNHLGDHLVRDLTDEGKPVTVRHLLSHYSGLTNETEMRPVWERKLPKSLEELAARTRAEFDPGVRYEYSNAGFALAGLLIEQVTGQSYADYLVEHLLKPTGSTNEGPVVPTAEVLEQLAFPYQIEGRQAKPEIPHRFDVFPAGDLYLSVPDMARVLLLHLNGGKYGDVRILSDQSLQEMRTRQFGGKGGLDFGSRRYRWAKPCSCMAARCPDGTQNSSSRPSHEPEFISPPTLAALCYPSISSHKWRSTCYAAKEIGTGIVKRIVHLGISFREDEKSELLKIGAIFPQFASKPGWSDEWPADPVALAAKVWKGKTLRECLRLMNGDRGTEVTLEIVDPGNSGARTVSLTKEPFLAPG